MKIMKHWKTLAAGAAALVAGGLLWMNAHGLAEDEEKRLSLHGITARIPGAGSPADGGGVSAAFDDVAAVIGKDKANRVISAGWTFWKKPAP